jgi:hypothetical protein
VLDVSFSVVVLLTVGGTVTFCVVDDWFEVGGGVLLSLQQAVIAHISIAETASIGIFFI